MSAETTDFGKATKSGFEGTTPTLASSTIWQRSQAFPWGFFTLAAPLYPANGLAVSPQQRIAEAVMEYAIDAAASLPASLRQNVETLAKLEANWDGEQAQPVKPHVLADVVGTLNRLQAQTQDFHAPFFSANF